jgi:hypothetical protein
MKKTTPSDNATAEICCADKRAHLRRHVNIPAVVKILSTENYYVCFLAKIIDISLGGTKLVFKKNDNWIIEYFKKQTDFCVVFEDEDKGHVFDVTCKPVHMVSNGYTKIGACFVDIATDDLKNLDFQYSLTRGVA